MIGGCGRAGVVAEGDYDYENTRMIAPCGARWGAPTFYGEKGVMKEIGGKAVCHICGKRFHHLGAHVVATHELTADDYRNEFGLNRSTGLISEALADKRRRQTFQMRASGCWGAGFAKGVSWLGRKHGPRSLQAMLNPARQENLENLKKIGAVLASLRRVPLTCVVCRAVFYRTRTQGKGKRAPKTCGRACFRVICSAHAKAQRFGLDVNRWRRQSPVGGL